MEIKLDSGVLQSFANKQTEDPQNGALPINAIMDSLRERWDRDAKSKSAQAQIEWEREKQANQLGLQREIAVWDKHTDDANTEVDMTRIRLEHLRATGQAIDPVTGKSVQQLEHEFEMMQIELTNEGKNNVANTQADGQRDVAGIKAGSDKYGDDLDAAAAANMYKLGEQELLLDRETALLKNAQGAREFAIEGLRLAYKGQDVRSPTSHELHEAQTFLPQHLSGTQLYTRMLADENPVYKELFHASIVYEVNARVQVGENRQTAIAKAAHRQKQGLKWDQSTEHVTFRPMPWYSGLTSGNNIPAYMYEAIKALPDHMQKAFFKALSEHETQRDLRETQ